MSPYLKEFMYVTYDPSTWVAYLHRLNAKFDNSDIKKKSQPHTAHNVLIQFLLNDNEHMEMHCIFSYSYS